VPGIDTGNGHWLEWSVHKDCAHLRLDSGGTASLPRIEGALRDNKILLSYRRPLSW